MFLDKFLEVKLLHENNSAYIVAEKQKNVARYKLAMYFGMPGAT